MPAKEAEKVGKEIESMNFPVDVRSHEELLERVDILRREIKLNDVPIFVPGLGGPKAIDRPKVQYWKAQVEALEWALGKPQGRYTWEASRW